MGWPSGSRSTLILWDMRGYQEVKCLSGGKEESEGQQRKPRNCGRKVQNLKHEREIDRQERRKGRLVFLPGTGSERPMAHRSPHILRLGSAI